MRFAGRISEWNDDRGFGFVVPNGGGDRVFVHINAFGRSGRRPALDDAITYQVRNDAKGRPNAFAVKPAKAPRKVAEPTRGGRVAWWIGALFLAALGVALFVGRLPLPVFLGYVGLSVLAIGMYWRDKSAARRGAWRTPESTLHIVALFGGWPGALIAQALFRHKSSKTTFRVVFWFTVLINVGVLAWLASTDAFAILEAAG